MVGTRKNCLNEAVLTCTHDLCFERKKEKYQNCSSENYHVAAFKVVAYCIGMFNIVMF